MLAQRHHGLGVQQRPQQASIKNEGLAAGQQLAMSIIKVKVGFGERGYILSQGGQRGTGCAVTQQVALSAQTFEGQLTAPLVSSVQVALVRVNQLASRSYAHHQQRHHNAHVQQQLDARAKVEPRYCPAAHHQPQPAQQQPEKRRKQKLK